MGMLNTTKDLSSTCWRTKNGQQRQRGAASVEAVIVLPVLLLVLSGLLYARDCLLEQQRAESRARSCAWLYSANGCQQVPVGCETILNAGPLTTPGSLSALGEELANARGKLPPDPLLDHVFDHVLKHGVGELFGSAARAEAHATVERPRVLGGGTSSNDRTYVVACNLTPLEPLDVAKTAWAKLWH